MEQNENGETKIKEARLQPGRMPNVVGMDISDAIYLLENMGVKTSFVGQGTVKEQSLQPGDTLRANSIIHLTLEKK